MKRTLEGCDVPMPERLETDRGVCVFFSTPGDGEGAENEDAAGVWELDDDSTVFALADGMGGGPAGGEAAALSMACLDELLDRWAPDTPLRRVIVDAFELANERLLGQGQGSGTTLVVAELSAGSIRTYHAGDSGAILVGQRGHVRHETMPHSPVGYAVAAGLLERDDRHAHEERHLLSNCLGSSEMRVEIGPPVVLRARDTLLLGSDGVLDNVRHETLVELIRKGSLEQGAARLQAAAQATMIGEGEVVGHPDDATALLYRIASPGRGGARA